MSVDKLVDSAQLNSNLTSVANAIRSKNGFSYQLNFPSGFVSGINNIAGGQERPIADENDVILIDFDGRILYSYTATEFATLQTLPTIPVIKYPFLVQDGWNWTLTDAKEYVAKYKELVIGAQYTTVDNKNHLLIDVPYPETMPIQIIIRIPNGGTSSGNSITMDWGDNSELDIQSNLGRNITVTFTHTYTQKGIYDIKMSSNHTGAQFSYSTTSIPYSGYVKAIAGNWSQTAGNAYPYGIYDLILLTGHTGTIGNMARYTCTPAYVYPRGFTGTAGNSNWFSASNTSYCVKYVSWPKGMQGALWGYNYQYCYALRKITPPEESIEIKANTLRQCVSLRRLNIMPGVTAISASAFDGCIGLREVHFYPTVPPTLENVNVFNSLSTDCKIYVPSGKLTNYTTASNYPDSTIYTYVEE